MEHLPELQPWGAQCSPQTRPASAAFSKGGPGGDMGGVEQAKQVEVKRYTLPVMR